MKKRTLSPGIPMPPYAIATPNDQNDTRHHSRETPEHGRQVEQIQQSLSRSLKDLREIPIDLIDQNPFAPREIYTPEMILERAESLRANGQNDPVHVIVNPEIAGRYIIADGWTRVLACREHKVFDTILAEVHHGLSPKDAAWLGFDQNESREQHCDLDRAMFFEKMIARGDEPVEVAAKAGLSKQMFSLYRAFRRLPEEVIDIVKMHPRKFGAWAASELAKLSEKAGSRRAVSVAIQFAEEDRSMRWLTSQVHAILDHVPKHGPSLVRQIRYGNGFFKQKGEKFEISISVPESRKDDFAIKLESLLETVAIPLNQAKEAPAQEYADTVAQQNDDSPT